LAEVILVDDKNIPIGTMDKIEVHQKGLLHRAFSIFIFNDKGEMLLQQRSISKFHSGGLWSNTCCSHPEPGETIHEAAVKRLHEEMGFATELTEVFQFIYKMEFDNGLTEFEFHHVFIGKFNEAIYPDNIEVRDHFFMSMDDIHSSIELFPDKYTEWFRITFPKLEKHLSPPLAEASI